MKNQFLFKTAGIMRSSILVLFIWSSFTIQVFSQSAPTLVNTTNVTSNSFKVNWTAPSVFYSYILEVYKGVTIVQTLYPSNSSTSYTVTNLSSATTYTYKMGAIGDSATPYWAGTKTVVTLDSPPAIPVANSAQSIEMFRFHAQWDHVSNGDSYLLFVSDVIDFSHLIVDGRSSTAYGSIVDNVEANTTYYYRVKAVNSAGTSGYSNIIKVTTKPWIPLARPATNVGKTSFTANWYELEKAVGYRFDLSTDKDFSSFVAGYQNVYISGGTNVSLNVQGLTGKTSFYYRIRGVDSSTGQSENSNTINALNLSQNFVKEVNIQVPDKKTLLEADNAQQAEQLVQYGFFDGLGRLSQSVSVGASPTLKDIVQPKSYDEFGRENINYLPYTSTADLNWYKYDFVPIENENYASASNPQYEFYQNTLNVSHDLKPYSQTIFERSPLNRVVKQGAPGSVWQPVSDPTNFTDHSIKMQYELNQSDDIVKFQYDVENETLDLSGGITYYPANELYATRTYDEENHQVIEFKDKEGKVILKRVEAPNNEWADTYYIYDDFGNLVMVLPPEGVKQLLVSSNQY